MTAGSDYIAIEIARIEALGLDELRSDWARRYGDAPSLRSVSMLRRLLSWRIQAEAFGDLDRATRRSLQRKGRGEAEGLNLGIGARLTRQWQGRHHQVIVEADGFRWEGQTFRSLSAAASAIAGSKWNGPRFFGLRSAA